MQSGCDRPVFALTIARRNRLMVGVMLERQHGNTADVAHAEGRRGSGVVRNAC